MMDGVCVNDSVGLFIIANLSLISIIHVIYCLFLRHYHIIYITNIEKKKKNLFNKSSLLDVVVKSVSNCCKKKRTETIIIIFWDFDFCFCFFPLFDLIISDDSFFFCLFHFVLSCVFVMEWRWKGNNKLIDSFSYYSSVFACGRLQKERALLRMASEPAEKSTLAEHSNQQQLL